MQVDFASSRTISHYAFRSIPILDFAPELVGRNANWESGEVNIGKGFPFRLRFIGKNDQGDVGSSRSGRFAVSRFRFH